jgi:hypothetical protein
MLKKITHRHNSILEHLVEAEPHDYATTDTSAFAQALARLRRVAKPGSLIYLFSDFRYLDDDCRRHLSRLGRHCELQAYPLSDPMDQLLPPPGNYALSDGREIKQINTSSSTMRASYQQMEQDRLQALADYFVQQRVNHQLLDTSANLSVVLAAQNMPRLVIR